MHPTLWSHHILIMVCMWSVSSHAHKATVQSVSWNRNGNWLLTAARDCLIKIFDIRAMKELCVLKGHKKDVNSMSLDMWTCNHLIKGPLALSPFSFPPFPTTAFLSSSSPLHLSYPLLLLAVAWHPIHETLFASGGSDGAILFWLVGWESKLSWYCIWMLTSLL